MDIRTLPAGPLGANCYLLSSGSAGVILDPGGEAGRIARECGAMGMAPAAILLTHGHFDHVGGVEELTRLFPGLSVYIHPGDVQEGPSQFSWTGIPDWQPLSDNQALSFGEIELKVIHTPGHSPGSVVFRWEDCLFTGDTLFRGSIGRTDLPGGDGRAMLASLERLAGLEGDFRVYPGHDAPTTLDWERRANPFLREAMG